MILLALDTSYGAGSLALVREDAREVVALPAEWKSATLHDELAKLLSRHGLSSSAVDVYAVASGPGAFTGLRIGLTAAKGLAEIHGKRMVTVSTLETVAAAAQAMLPENFSGWLAPVLDARRGQVFAALYHVQPGLLNTVIAENVCALRTFLEQARSRSASGIHFCGPDIESFRETILEAGWEQEALVPIGSALADTLAGIAMERVKEGKTVSPEQADANYVRASDAELFWKG